MATTSKRSRDAADIAHTPATDQGTPKPEPEGISVSDVVNGVRELRIRHQLVPIAVIASLHAGAALASAIDAAAGPEAQAEHTTSLITGGVYLVLAVVAWYKHDKAHPENRRSRRRYTTTVVLSGLAWFALATVAGAGGLIGAGLWLGGYALAWPYWRTHRIEAASEVEEEPEVDAEALDDVQKAWRTYVANPNGALADSRLSAPMPTKSGPRYDVQLAKGRHTAESVIAATARIASALDKSLDAIVIDHHPTGIASRAKLLIAENNPLPLGVPYPGPGGLYDQETGYAKVGIHPDTESAEWAFFIPGWGLAGGAIFGGIGGGKSSFMTNLALTAMYAGNISVWAGDPQGGQSMPEIIRYAPWPATTMDEIMRQLRAAAKAIEIRGALNGLRGVGLHVPTPAEPGILLFLDELHKITAGHDDAKEAIALLDLIAREGRKCAVALEVAEQYPGVSTFGNLDSMRTSIMAKNCAVFRIPSLTTKGIIPGLELSPAQIPERFPNGLPTSGLGYLIGHRTAIFRAMHVKDHIGNRLLSVAPDTPLDEVVANFIGADYTDRAARRLNARAAQAARIEELSPDMLAGILQAQPELAGALKEFKSRPRPTKTQGAASARTTTTGTVLTLAPAPKFTTEPAVTIQEETDSIQPLQVLTTDVGRAVYDAICRGITRTKDILTAVPYSETHVRNCLKQLVAEGLVDGSRFGHWGLMKNAA